MSGAGTGSMFTGSSVIQAGARALLRKARGCPESRAVGQGFTGKDYERERSIGAEETNV